MTAPAPRVWEFKMIGTPEGPAWTHTQGCGVSIGEKIKVVEMSALTRALEENEIFRKALEWYANEENICDETGVHGEAFISPGLPVNYGREWDWDMDGGKRAREALASIRGE